MFILVVFVSRRSDFIKLFRDLNYLESERISKSDSLEVCVAVVSPEQWSHFSATAVFLGRGRWTFIQFTPDRSKLEERLQSLIWEVGTSK